MYEDLRAGFEPSCINRLWISDITYIRTRKGFCFLSLVTDAYSLQIIGWRLGSTLEYRYTREALEMALRKLTGTVCGLIHHSDRGLQYCYRGYTDPLREKGSDISMTQTSDPRDNAIAERVNGILKEELGITLKAVNLFQERSKLSRILLGKKRAHVF